MEITLVEDVMKEMKKDVRDIQRGIYRHKSKRVMTPDSFVKIFSPQRVRLLMALRKNKVESITELAALLGRKFEAVHRDITYLSGMGFIKLKKGKKNVVPTAVKEITAVV